MTVVERGLGALERRLMGILGREPSQLAREREKEIADVLFRYEQGFARLLEEITAHRHPPAWRVQNTPGENRVYLILRKGDQRLQDARCEWSSRKKTTVVAFGRGNTIRTIALTRPSAVVLAASGITILEHALPASPGLMRSGRVGALTIRPVAKRDGSHAGTGVDMLIPFRLKDSTLLSSNNQLRSFTFRVTSQGIASGRLMQEGRCLSEYVYPHFNMAGLTEAALHEAFGELLEPAPALLSSVKPT